MTDEELVKRLRNAKVTQDFRHTLEDEAANRIEELEGKIARVESANDALEGLRPVWAQGWTNDSMAAQASGNALAQLWKMLGAQDQTQAVATLKALTEQLEAAQADAKEAEAYAEELERDLKTCRMAQVVMDNTVTELEKERDRWREIANNEAVEGEANRNAGLALEAKLAKAVEVLQLYAGGVKSAVYARTALAELEGK
jgi:chromosome segregation ATPase